MLKVLTVVGARPQFIKAAPVSRALKEAGHAEYLVHTGQHYDYEMSQVFFEELSVPRPDINLEVGSGPHGRQTGQMMALIEEVLQEQRPDWVVVYGDTNSTMAGALAAAKLRMPVVHVEAGLRSFNREMPEEVNRVVTDHLSTRLMCPTKRAVDQLASEGVVEGAILTGDVMLDAFEHDRVISRGKPSALDRLGLGQDGYVLMTLHRAANTDNLKTFALRMEQVGALGQTVVWPGHPRAVSVLSGGQKKLPDNVRLIDPTARLETIQLLEGASALITDSGGLQKEAYWAQVPCFTLRTETEWAETVEAGWNTLVSGSLHSLRDVIEAWRRPSARPDYYGDGCAAEAVVKALGGSVSGSDPSRESAATAGRRE